MHLLVEARIHDVAGRTALGRALGVWSIGLGWALMVAAFDMLVIAPIFTEDYLALASSSAWWAFSVLTLASLDLGIFLQILREDRPVTYPIGALHFSRRA